MNIEKRGITTELKESYLDYAMSVIVSRALPDVRDGLKPVQRRILWAMWETGLKAGAKTRKSAAVVGEVMKSYHPHGDASIYDALTRMVQDFSLRYPLVEGQGNWGCFTDDTKVSLTDGRSLSFKELIREYNQGKKNYTLTFNHETEEVEVAQIKQPRLTRSNAKLVKVTLDNGEELRCTPDHKFLLRSGEYRPAQNLKAGDSLMPAYFRFSTVKDDSRAVGYRMIFQPVKAVWSWMHRLSDAYNIRCGVYAVSTGRVRHHKDFNKLNNNPENIARMGWKEHWQLHADFASWRHHNDPAYVEKLKKGREAYYANPAVRQKISKRYTAMNLKKWANFSYRTHMSHAAKERWATGIYDRERLSKQAQQNLKALWQDPIYARKMSRLKSEGMKARWQNPAYRAKWHTLTKEISRRIWADPNHRIRISALMRKRWDDPSLRSALSVQSKQLWQSASYRAHYAPDHFSKMAAALWGKPEMRTFHREKLQAQRLDPKFITRMRAGLARMNKKRLAEDPNLMHRLAKKASASLHKKWQDPAYKQMVLRSRILGYVYGLIQKYGEITPKRYEHERPNHIPSLVKTSSYFKDFQEIADKAPLYNHRVVSVDWLAEREDVYDLTINSTHNFALAAGIFVHNSIDGDNQAAMRYTECRLAKISEELLADIEKETVAWLPNYDASTQEPKVMPAKLPNLLLNGAVGIAVGMATSIPPHNIREVIDAALHLIDHPKANVSDLLEFVQGPDFPTGGVIYDRKAILEAYSTGRGAITTRGTAEVRERTGSKGAFDIVIAEIPYQVNKSELIIKIAELVTDKRIDGVRDVRDESDKEGLRIVIELKNDAAPQKTLNQLWNHTDLQKDFHLNMIALVPAQDPNDKSGKARGLQPQVLSLKDVLAAYVNHREEVVRRRAEFDLKKARERAHILEGLSKALSVIDKIIETIKKSRDKEDAARNLIARFRLTEIQANAILEMRLATLAALEREKIENELKEKRKLIEDLELLLKNRERILKVVKGELNELKSKYGDERRTKIIAHGLKEFREEDLIPEEEAVITFSGTGYVKRLPPNSFRSQKRGGKGLIGSEVADEDFLTHLISANTHDNILFFTDHGRVFQTKVWEIPAASRIAKGKPIHNFLEIPAEEKVSAIIAYTQSQTNAEDGQRMSASGLRESAFLVMLTTRGMIKKTTLQDFQNVRRTGIIAMRLKKGDLLRWVLMSGGKDQVIITTSRGQSIRFKESQVRSMGRAASGVKAIRLKAQDEVSSMDILKEERGKGKEEKLLVVMANGFGKQTPVSQYRLQSRGGSGIKTAKITSKTGLLIDAHLVSDEEELIALSAKGQVIRTKLSDVRVASRATQGVKIMSLNAGDKVAGIVCL